MLLLEYKYHLMNIIYNEFLLRLYKYLLDMLLLKLKIVDKVIKIISL